MKNNIEISVLGLWHLGSVYSACLAELGFSVTGFDENSSIVKNLSKGKPPIEEPLLETTIKKYLGNNLHFTSTPEKAIVNKKYIFITYDVPVDDTDKVDLSIIERTFLLLEQNISPGTTVVVSSQLPIGSSRKFLSRLQSKQEGINIIYFPENLRLGNAFASFLQPDRIVIGSNLASVNDQFEKDFEALSCPFIKLSLESAEMVKHALNSYLAMMISYSSEMSDLAEIFGANMNEVVLALKSEKRVSKFAPLNPGLGFAGGTLGRDIQTLRKLGKQKNHSTPLLDSIYRVNQQRLPSLIKKLKTIAPNLKGKSVGILGLTYKPKTNTLRRSMSVELASLLKEEGVDVKALDPSIRKKIETLPFLKVSTNYKDFFTDLDLVILMTEWEEFNQIDWKKSERLMKTPVIFDCKNFFDKNALEENKFAYYGIGYPL